MRKDFVLLLILVLFSSSTLVSLPVNAQFQGNITISSDGSISPSSAPLAQAGNTYALTGDVTGNITVNRTNAILDGGGRTIRGRVVVQALSSGVIKNCVITDTTIGLRLLDCSNVQVVSNTITKTGVNGILFYQSFDSHAIQIVGGRSNVVVGNNLADNFEGICLMETERNLIVANNITGSGNPTMFYSYGLAIWESSNNSIYHNNFIDNKLQTNVHPFTNVLQNMWDNSHQDGGNYWSDYWAQLEEFRKTHPNAESIYFLDDRNIDFHPLMQPFNILTYRLEIPAPTISILSPITQTYNNSNVPIDFVVDTTVNWTGYSLDREGNVTITGNPTPTMLRNGLHNVTIYANDTFGNMDASETVSFTVDAPEPFPLVPVAAAVVLISLGLLILSWKIKPRSGAVTPRRSQTTTKCSLNRVNSLFPHTPRWWRNA